MRKIDNIIISLKIQQEMVKIERSSLLYFVVTNIFLIAFTSSQILLQQLLSYFFLIYPLLFLITFLVFTNLAIMKIHKILCSLNYILEKSTYTTKEFIKICFKFSKILNYIDEFNELLGLQLTFIVFDLNLIIVADVRKRNNS